MTLHDSRYEPIKRPKTSTPCVNPWTRGQLYPRDVLSVQEEIQLRQYNIDRLPNQNGKNVFIELVTQIVTGCKKCRIDLLFDRHCRLDSRYSKHSFNIKHSLDAYTDYNQIVRFFYHIYRTIIPTPNLFGTQKNFKLFMAHIRQLIEAGRRVTIKMSDFIDTRGWGICLDDIPWLAHHEVPLKLDLFYSVLVLLIKIYLGITSNYFYITTSNSHSDRIFYFRYDLWAKIATKQTQIYIEQEILEPIVMTESANAEPNLFTISNLRFMLKSSGLRPIGSIIGNKYSIREATSKFCAVLKAVESLVGCQPIFSLELMRDELKKCRQLCREYNCDPLIVRTDIANFFASVNQQKLVDIITREMPKLADVNGHIIVEKYRYITPIFSALRLNNKRPIFRVRTSLVPSNVDLGQWELVGTYKLDYKALIQVYLKPYVIKPTIRCSSKGKIGFRLLSGLRQGASLSPLLASIYLRSAFSEHLSHIIDSNECRLFQYVDDIIFFTSNNDKGRRFLHAMFKGFPDYSLRSNIEKVYTNFQITDQQQNCLSNKDGAVFYRYKIDSRTLECRYDYSHYGSVELEYSFLCSPYANYTDIGRLMKSYPRRYITSILVDNSLNSRGTIVINLFERMLFGAFRVGTMMLKSLILRHYEGANTIVAGFSQPIARNQSQRNDPSTGFRFDWKFPAKMVSFLARRTLKVLNLLRGKEQLETEFTETEIHLITCVAFARVWSHPRLIRRKWERDNIEILRRKILSSCADQTRRKQLLDLERQLIGHYDGSLFHNSMILPA